MSIPRTALVIGMGVIVLGVGAMTHSGPRAADDYSSTAKATEVNVSVLTNDIYLRSGPVTVSLVSLPAHGIVVVEEDDSITYQPEAGFVGTDAFTYELVSRDGASDQALVRVRVNESELVVVRGAAATTVLAAQSTR